MAERVAQEVEHLLISTRPCVQTLVPQKEKIRTEPQIPKKEEKLFSESRPRKTNRSLQYSKTLPSYIMCGP
jgi:hypothetical protein